MIQSLLLALILLFSNDYSLNNCLDKLYKIEEKIMIQNMERELSENDLLNFDNQKVWFLQYKEILNKYSLYCDEENIYEVFSDEEIKYMQKCIETEAYGTDFKAKSNVASVILNRIYSEKFPDNAIDVITHPNQFTYFRVEITEDTVLALEYAFLNDTTQGALYFHSGEKKEEFNNAQFIFQDHVGHNFYK